MEEIVLDDIPSIDGYYVYLLLCNNGALYCGWTTNLHQRFHQHRQGKGAKYTRANPPKKIYYYESMVDASSARKREYAIKQMTHKEKLLLQKR